MSNPLPLSHNDTAKADDAFNQTDFIKQVSELIKNCDPPKGIGINGYWGAGKTSTLMQIHNELTGYAPFEHKKSNDKTIVPVWFEAWRYQSESLPIVALLQEIRAQIGIWQKLVNSSKKLGEITIASLGIDEVFNAIFKAASGNMLSPSIGKISERGRRWETEHQETPLASQDLLKLLEQAIEQALHKTARLVIFIDDLDRCQPEVALKLLEGIKVYLNLKNCVLVFGMDQRQIEDALKKALNTQDTHQAREYLEKICQDIHHLPIPNKIAKVNYVLELLKGRNDVQPERLGLNMDERDRPSLTAVERATLVALTESQKKDKANAHCEAIKKVLIAYDCLPANPRKIKALSNRLALQLCKGCIQGLPQPLTTPETNETPDRRYMLLVAMSIIYNFHRQLNEQLEKDPEYINQVITYARNPPAYPLSTSTLNRTYEPMRDIIPCYEGTAMDKFPTNPSDSNVFRLHELFRDLVSITDNELKPFLDSHS